MKKIFLTTLLTLVCAIGFADTWTDSDGNVWRFDITDNENHYVTLTGLQSGTNATVPGAVKVGEDDYCVKAIGEKAFYGNQNIKAVSNLSSCTTIGKNAFYECKNLSDVGELPACTSIGETAFMYCVSLAKIGNLAACTNIGGGAFECCYALNTITVDTDVVPTIQYGILNSVANTTTILVKDNMLSSFRNAKVWSTFATYIVSMNAEIERNINVTPPTEGSGIYNAIGVDNLSDVVSLKLSGEINGYDFFIMRNYMPNLHSVDMSDVRIVAASNNYPYYSNYYTKNDIFPAYAFYQNRNITSIILPNNVTQIDKYAMNDCRYLQNIEIPGNVEIIGDNAFQDCVNLKSVILHKGIKTLGSSAFDGCKSISPINFPVSLETIGNSCFYNTKNLGSIILPPSLVKIGDRAFNSAGVSKLYATALDPKTVKMAANAFTNYSYTVLYIPYDGDSGWDATYNAYFWDTDWGQFTQKEKWTPKYTDVTINADYEQDKGTIPSEENVNIDGQIGTNGGYILGENASQELGNVTVEQNDEKGGSIIGEGNDNLTIENLQCNIKITPNKWYFFCFPFDVDWTEIDYAGVRYIWHKYDGSERAQGNGGWKKLQGNVDDKILHAGEGYIFQANKPFTLTIQCENPNMAAVDKAKELTTYVSSNPENASWNLIGNPFLSYFNMDGMGNTGNTEQYSAPVTVYDGNNYQALRPGDDDYQFHPFQAFFVQKPAGETALTFGSEGRETYTQSVEVQKKAKARRAKIQKDPNRQIINLTISDGENEDKTRVVFNEAKSMAYEAECDASKFFTTEAVPQIYSVCNGVSYSINERPGAEGCVDLGVKISKDGTYTIEAARMDTPMLLIDHEAGITADMSEGAYNFTAKAGTYAKRFSIVKAENATAITGTDSDVDNADVYDLNGRKVTSAQSGVVIKANKKVLMK